MRKKDHLAINRAITKYEEHSSLLRSLSTNDTMGERQIYDLISNEIGYMITLLANELLEFGVIED